MRPLQNPDAVRLGDWRDLSFQRQSPEKKAVRRKATKVAVAFALLTAGAFIALSAHVAQTQDRSPSAAAESVAITATAELGSAPAMARMPVEFVDDWTFVYPAPLPN